MGIYFPSRNRQPPEDGIMCELLWSDPQVQQKKTSKGNQSVPRSFMNEYLHCVQTG